MPSVHSGKLERWLGPATIEQLGKNMQGWYGPPIGCSNIPGQVYVTPDGDFIGKLDCGEHTSQFEYYMEKYKKWLWKLYTASKSTANMAGFASLSELISEATTASKRQELIFLKTGVTGVAGSTTTLFRVGGQPASGVSVPSAPGGGVPGSGTQGALAMVPTSGGDTLHFVSANVVASVAGTLLLYDRIFQVAKTMSSVANEPVTGVPTRYQNTVAGTADSAEGNFLFIECNTALGATAHNWNACKYTNHAGVSGTLPSLTGNASNIAWRLDMPAYWFAPLAAGDRGISNILQMQCSASVTGGVDFVIGHPIAWITCAIANVLSITDGVNGAFGLTRVFDNACLALLDVAKTATTATNYSGSIVCVAG